MLQSEALITQLETENTVLSSNGRLGPSWVSSNWPAVISGRKTCEASWCFFLFCPSPFVTVVNDTKGYDSVTEITFSKQGIPKMKFIQIQCPFLKQWTDPRL